MHLSPGTRLISGSWTLQELGVQPFSVHVNGGEGGLKGKRHRLREAALWADPPAYFEDPLGYIQASQSAL